MCMQLLAEITFQQKKNPINFLTGFFMCFKLTLYNFVKKQLKV